MRAVVQRVTQAISDGEGRVVGAIQRGLAILARHSHRRHGSRSAVDGEQDRHAAHL